MAEGCPRFPQPYAVVHIFGLPGRGIRQPAQRLQGFLDCLAQAAGVKGFPKALPGLGCFRRQHASGQQPLERGGDGGLLFAVGFAHGAHEGQEKVVIHIQQAIEGVEGSDLSEGVVAAPAHIRADVGVVVFFHEAVVVFVVRAATRVGSLGLDPGFHGVVEEFGPVVGVDFLDVEGQSVLNGLEGVVDDEVAVTEGRVGADPAGVDIGEAKGVSVLAAGVGAAVLDSVGLEETRQGGVVGDGMDRDTLMSGAAAVRASVRASSSSIFLAALKVRCRVSFVCSSSPT